MMGIDEEGTLTTLSDLRTITDALIAEHSGRICGTAGDSVLAAFASVFAAVQCAVEIQRDVARANEQLADGRRMWFQNRRQCRRCHGEGRRHSRRRQVRPTLRSEPHRYEGAIRDIDQNTPGNRYRLTRNRWSQCSGNRLRTARYGGGGCGRRCARMTWSWTALARTRLDEYMLNEGVVRTSHEDAVELLFWESVRNSDNPSSLRAYLEKYPDGDFRVLAEIQLNELDIS